MTDDTKKALEIIQPIADLLDIKVSANENYLYADHVRIGITFNSTRATVMEFIGFLFMAKYHSWRQLDVPQEMAEDIERYWSLNEEGKG